MKFLSIILSVIIMILVSTPCCSGTCQADSCKEKSSDKHKDCGDNCSPFYSCGSCTGFICSYAVSVAVEVNPSYDILTPAHYTILLISRFPDSIWQPPKIA
ncbi:DUF6660 family protein [Flavobacterium hauense]